ncbi:MAG: FecR family protein [Fibrobacterota bacterium]
MKTQHIILTVLLLSALLSAESPLGKISFFIGDVSVFKDSASGWAKAKINMPVGQGNALKTGKSSRCEVVLTDSRMLRLSENTEATVTAPEDAPAVIKAKSGSVWANVKKVVGRKSTFEVSTPVATAAIRGTVFGVDCDSTKANCLVFRGTVAVSSDKSGKPVEVDVKAGEQMVLTTDIDKYLKEQEEAFKNYLEQSEAEFEKFQQEQEQQLNEFEKSQNEDLEKMMNEERSAFQDMGNGLSVVKRAFDEKKFANPDWVEWNKKRDKELGWDK